MGSFIARQPNGIHPQINMKAKCPHCGTEFKATSDDIGWDLDFYFNPIFPFLTCPNCSGIVYEAELDVEEDNE